MAGDKTYIEDDFGKKHRATRTKAVTPESIVWSSNPNDYTVQVLVDGKWHRAILTYDVKDATFFDNINIDKALVTGGDGKTHTALIVSPEASEVIMSSIPTDEHSLISGTTTGETVVNTYSENWSNVVWQDNVNVYKVLVEGSDGKKHTALLTTKGGGGSVEIIVKGVSPLSLPDAIADSLEYLKAFGGTEQRNLPTGYTQLEYIESTGTQYINTGYAWTSANHKVVAKVSDMASGTNQWLWGSFTGNTNIRPGVLSITSSTTLSVGVGNVGTTSNRFTINIPLTPTTLTLEVKSNNTFSLLGGSTTYTNESFSGTVITGIPEYIFCQNGSGTSAEQSKYKLYSFQMYDNNTLVRNFIPCKNAAGVVGMYDTISGTFFTNAGTGNFIGGAPVDPVLPDNYIRRDYIYMLDGSYLLTDIVPTYDGHYEMDFQTTTMPNAGGSFMGGRNNSYPAGLTFGWAQTSKYALFDGFGDPGVNDDRYVSTTPFENNTRYKYIFDNQNVKLLSNGATIINYTFTKTNANGGNLCINGLNNNGTVIGNIAGIYLYSFKVWNAQGELIANYVPAIQKGTVPVVGFYDTVSGTFKTATAGTFAAGGEAVPTPDAPMDIWCNNGALKVRHQSGLPLSYTALEYIESTGTQYIDTGIGLNSAYKYRLVVASVNGNNASNIWGYKSNASYTGGPCYIIGWTGSPTTHIGAYNKNGNITGAFPVINALRWTAETFFDILLDVTQSNFSVNDTNYYSTSGVSTALTTDSWTDTHHPYLFGTQTVDSAVPSSAIRVKAYQVRDTNGDLIQNFVPCKNASNVVGMYDTVNGVFYQNAGTDTFIAGSAVSDPVEIYTDGTVETINVHGKNLFDKDGVTIENGKAIGADGSISNVSSVNLCASYIPVSPNTTYTFSGDVLGTSNTFFRVAQYKADQTFISRSEDSTGARSSYTFTTGADTHYIRFHYIATANISTYQLELGSAATEYVPFFDGGTATAEMLLKVGDYEDVQEILSGAITRSVGVKVLDGTENWENLSGYMSVLKTNLGANSVVLPANSTNIFCTHFQVKTDTFVDGVGSGNSYVNFKYDSVFTTLAQFKQWLAAQYNAGTPVIIVYPLATPTTESVAGQALQVQQGDNIVEITQAAIDGLEIEAKYQAAVTLTIQEVQDANLDPNVEVTIN